jgi:hypothetical protein
VLAASLWTWLWGPLGLLLSTPLPLCLVVLARHVERLQFIHVMLGDEPALTPQQAAYQRMLTGDPIEAIEQARSFLKGGSIQNYYDEILLGALRLAEADAAVGRLNDARLENIRQTVSEIVEDLAAHETPKTTAPPEHTSEKDKVVNIGTSEHVQSVLCIPGLGRLDVCAALVVADVLKRQGIVARTAESPTVVEADNARTICVCFLEDVTEARTDFTQRKLSRQAPSAKIVVCLLGEPKDIKDSEEPRADVPSRSSKNVLLALEKNAAPSIRSEL